jgi:predicted O-methyltransferase YrrM
LHPIAIGPREGAALRRRVLSEQAQATLEVGLGYGIATLYICEALLENHADARHVTIDPYQFVGRDHHRTRLDGAGIRALEQAGIRDLVEFYEEESQIALPRLLHQGRRFDLAFLDGNHRFEGVFLDLIYSGRLLKERGIVFVVDTQLNGVSKAVNFCLTNLGWSVEDTGAEGDAHEWAVLRVSAADVFQRPFNHFVEF